jgi:AraC-like DNA-binding protein
MVPGQVHAWDLVGDTDGYIINFSKSFFYSFLLRPEFIKQFPFLGGGIEEAVISLPENVMQKVVPALETILEEGQLHEAYRLDMIRVLLLQVFLSVHRALSKKPGNNIVSAKFIIIRNFQNLVEQHFTSIRLPKDYAALLYITPNHLNALCKEILGKPAGEVIRERVLLEAKRLLIEATYSITEVAAQLNFQDNSYFTKFFKKYTAVTPEEFRRTNI